MGVGDRREFLRAASAVALSAAVPADLFAQAAVTRAPGSTWDAGSVRHLLPTVSDNRILIKASFNAPLSDAPMLRIDGTSVRGRMGDTRGEHWHFYTTGLKPGRSHRLSLVGAKGRPLCQPWELATFPGPDERPEKFRLLIYSCAGGHEIHKFLPTMTRSRLLRRALSFAPQAVIANGDHVYWDLLAPVNKHILGRRPTPSSLPGRSTVRLSCSGATMKPCSSVRPVRRSCRSTGPISARRRSSSCRTITTTSTTTRRPTRRSRSRPRISCFSSRARRRTSTTRSSCPMWRVRSACPRHRPATACGACRRVSERCGSAVLPKSCSTTCAARRRWRARAPSISIPRSRSGSRRACAATEVSHVVHVPSNPPGWTAGKWGEWYPDVLGRDGKLTASEPKPYWQSGWLKQHDRLMQAMSAMKGRSPLVISGDLHAIGIGRMLRSGALDLKSQSHHHRAVRAHRLPAEPDGLAVRAAWYRRDAACASRHGRTSEAHRAARLHHRGFFARQNRAAYVQVGLEDSRRGSDRHAGAVSPNGADSPYVN